MALGGAEWKDHEILAPGDVSGDGHTDLWVRSTDGQLERFLSAGAAALPADPPTIPTAPVASYPPAGAWSATSTATAQAAGAAAWAVAVSVRQRGRSETRRRRAA
ncbi:hypothetical protein ACIA74_37285 [Streptomyces sp. NPDC051658]|uniref:hypothetical protein n=1 Tax=Streptomyces sp. NPDC051658 TaxID=3365667 RepID=UPI0037B41A28